MISELKIERTVEVDIEGEFESFLTHWAFSNLSEASEFDGNSFAYVELSNESKIKLLEDLQRAIREEIKRLNPEKATKKSVTKTVSVD